MGGVRVGLFSCGGGGGGGEWGIKNMLIFLWVESNLACVIGRGGGVKMKFQEQGGDFVWVFLWKKKVRQKWKFMTLNELEAEMGGD